MERLISSPTSTGTALIRRWILRGEFSRNRTRTVLGKPTGQGGTWPPTATGSHFPQKAVPEAAQGMSKLEKEAAAEGTKVYLEKSGQSADRVCHASGQPSRPTPARA